LSNAENIPVEIPWNIQGCMGKDRLLISDKDEIPEGKPVKHIAGVILYVSENNYDGTQDEQDPFPSVKSCFHAFAREMKNAETKQDHGQ
jgi:hypothetical protein